MIVFKRLTGEKARMARLTNLEAWHIRKCANRGVPNENLAALFGVSVGCVSKIKHGRTYPQARKGL